MTVLSLILTLVVPGAVVALCLLPIGLLTGRGGDDAPRPRRPLPAWVLPPMAAVIAVWSADIGLNQFHPVWDRDGTQRYLAVVIAAGLAGLIHAALGRGWLTAVLRALLGAGVGAIVLMPLAGGQYVPWGVFAGLLVSSAVWLAVVGQVLDHTKPEIPRLLGPACMLLAVAAAGPGLYFSGYAGGATFFGTLAAIAGGLAVAALPPRSTVIDRQGLHSVWLAMLAAVLLVTYGYNDVPSVWPLVGFAVAPLGLLAVRAPGPWWRRSLAGLWFVGVIAGGSTVAAKLAAGDDGNDGSGYDYDPGYEYDY